MKSPISPAVFGGLGMMGKALSHRDLEGTKDFSKILNKSQIFSNFKFAKCLDFSLLQSLFSLNPAVHDCHLKFLLQN